MDFLADPEKNFDIVDNSRGNFSIFILFSYIFIYFLLTKSLQFEQFRIRSQISQFEKSLLLNVEILRNFSSFRIFTNRTNLSR